MSITIKRNKKPDLPVCQMVCDKKIHPKLDKYELTKFLNCHSTNLLIGKPGSGKTSLIYQIMKSISLRISVMIKYFYFNLKRVEQV